MTFISPLSVTSRFVAPAFGHVNRPAPAERHVEPPVTSRADAPKPSGFSAFPPLVKAPERPPASPRLRRKAPPPPPPAHDDSMYRGWSGLL